MLTSISNFDDILIVIVLYNCDYEFSSSFNTISLELDKLKLPNSPELFIYDNSPITFPSRIPKSSLFNITFVRDVHNSGISRAYELALKHANEFGHEWLLLLDQDSLVTKNYISEIKSILFSSLDPKIVSIIPNVFSQKDNFRLSPMKVFPGNYCRPILLESGVITKRITALNSGSIIKVSFLNTFNIFPNKYFLDMLDHFIYRSIYQNDLYVFLMKSFIQHNLSVQSAYEQNISIDRYRQILQAEYLLINEDAFYGRSIYIFRLFFRVFKQFGFRRRHYLKYTVNSIFGILFQQ